MQVEVGLSNRSIDELQTDEIDLRLPLISTFKVAQQPSDLLIQTAISQETLIRLAFLNMGQRVEQLNDHLIKKYRSNS